MFTKLVEFTAAYDKRHVDPAKNYGIHGVEIRFLLTGPAGVVHFLLYTDWFLPETLVKRGLGTFAADLGYHSPVPCYPEQSETSPDCSYLGGRPCYSDGSAVAAARVFNRLKREGDAGVWAELEAYYAETFGPAAAE